MLPQNTRRYSTHSLQRNSRFSVSSAAAAAAPLHNYIDLQSHLFSIPTGPAGAAIPGGATLPHGTTLLTSHHAQTPLYMLTPAHLAMVNKTATLSNKTLNKAAINSFNSQQLHQQPPPHSLSHSPSASFSSQGSRHTGGSSSQHHRGSGVALAMTPMHSTNDVLAAYGANQLTGGPAYLVNKTVFANATTAPLANGEPGLDQPHVSGPTQRQPGTLSTSTDDSFQHKTDISC